jgi:CheY-like chemotaxis protein
MSLRGPIISIDDDPDDQYLIECMIEELDLPNELLRFENGAQAHDYLLTTEDSPLLILCDINMPVMNGLELRDHIDSNPYLKQKAIPFIFLSTSAEKKQVERAFSGNIQGYFQKKSDYATGKAELSSMIAYWKSCLHPNNFI